MRVRFPVAVPCAFAVLWSGCAERSAIREHDAMVTALARAGGAPAVGEDVVLGAAVLERRALVAAVLARNPELDVARETWRAAIAGYPSAVALDDPMASYAVAPFSIGSAAARLGQAVELRQRIPWPGKRRLAGAAAIAEAQVAQADLASMRLELAEAAVDAFDDDYVATRALEVNQHHRALLERIERSAIAQYTVGRGSQQDPLEARAEIIALDRERLTLETQRLTAVARINRLLQRRPDAALPPPPARLDVAPPATTATALHPKLQSATARIRARQADADHAERAFYPDLEVMASYDSMWDIWQHRWMIGVGIEIPLQRANRRASVELARAAQAKATAELASLTDILAEDRDRSHRELEESAQALGLYEDQLLPTERARVAAAIAGFTAGQNPFSTVVMAEHALRGAELQVEQIRADLDRRTAALDRVEGRIPGGAQ